MMLRLIYKKQEEQEDMESLQKLCCMQNSTSQTVHYQLFPFKIKHRIRMTCEYMTKSRKT